MTSLFSLGRGRKYICVTTEAIHSKTWHAYLHPSTPSRITFGAAKGFATQLDHSPEPRCWCCLLRPLITRATPPRQPHADLWDEKNPQTCAHVYMCTHAHMRTRSHCMELTGTGLGSGGSPSLRLRGATLDRGGEGTLVALRVHFLPPLQMVISFSTGLHHELVATILPKHGHFFPIEL